MQKTTFLPASQPCRAAIQPQLFSLQDREYRSFHSKLIPNVPPGSILGIRMPQLRKLAKSLASGKLYDPNGMPLRWQDFFCETEAAYAVLHAGANPHAPADSNTAAAALESSALDASAPLYYEEILLAGLALSYAKLPLTDRLPWIQRFVPMIDNWAVCDTFCGTYKPTEAQLPAVWDFITENYLPPRAKTDAEYALRYGVVMLLTHFVSREAYIDRVLALCNEIHHPAYYVKMAVAWTLSYGFIFFPEQTIGLFRSADNRLDDFTYNKSIQKARESYRIPEQTKALLQAMRRETPSAGRRTS